MGPSRAIGSSCLAGETFLLRVWKVELAHPRTRIGPGPEWPSSEASSGLPGTLGLREASAGRQAVRIRSAVLEGGQPAATFPRTLLTSCQAFLERTAGGRGKRPQRRRLGISPPEMGRTSLPPVLPTFRAGGRERPMRGAPGCPCLCRHGAGGVCNHRTRKKTKKQTRLGN